MQSIRNRLEINAKIMLKFVSSTSAVGVKILLAICTCPQMNNFSKKIKLLNSVVLEIVLVSYLQKNLLAVFQIAVWFVIGCHSDSLLILLVVGFDDLSHRQENIRSKFNNIHCYH